MKTASSPQSVVPSVVPSEADRTLARDSARDLSLLLGRKPGTTSLKVAERGGKQPNAIPVPASALPLIADLLTQLARGRAVTIIPLDSELTTQQAADFLGVSRPHFVKMLDGKELPSRKVGTHRRVLFADLTEFKSKRLGDRRKALDELASEAQKLGLGY
jgi:excisionase family DNA binding protein